MIYFDDVLVFLLFVLVQCCSLRMDEDTVGIVTNNYNKLTEYFITKSWSTDIFLIASIVLSIQTTMGNP